MKNKNKKIDIYLLIAFPIIATIISFLAKTNFLISTLLFFVPIDFWLSFKNKKLIKKTFVFSVLFSLPSVIIFDYIMIVTNTWHITKSIFAFRLFNIIALEQFIWGFLWTYSIIIFYEYFFDNRKKKSIFNLLKIKKEKIIKIQTIWMTLFFLILIIILLSVNINKIQQIQHSYLIFGTILILIPLILFLLKFPNLFTKFIKTTIYFFFLAIIIEITGLNLNHWTFGNNFISQIITFNYLIPLEEIFFYFIISTPAVLSYYEFFIDDRK